LIALLLWKRKYGILLGLTGLFNEILVKMKEDVLGKMMERMLDFLLGNTHAWMRLEIVVNNMIYDIFVIK